MGGKKRYTGEDKSCRMLVHTEFYATTLKYWPAREPVTFKSAFRLAQLVARGTCCERQGVVTAHLNGRQSGSGFGGSAVMLYSRPAAILEHLADDVVQVTWNSREGVPLPTVHLGIQHQQQQQFKKGYKPREREKSGSPAHHVE